MPAQLITPPAAEPVTLAEARAHLRLEVADDDAYLLSLITMARQYVEEVCWRGLVKQTWELVLDSFQGEDTLELGARGRRIAGNQGTGFTELPRGNLSTSGFLPYIVLPKGNLWIDPNNVLPAVSTVKYWDETGVQQTLASTEYVVDTEDVPGRLRLGFGKYWPSTQWPRYDAVRIRYLVGWDVTAGVWGGPVPIKQALLLLISQLYEHRSPEVIARGIVQIQFSADALLSPYRLNRGL